MACRLFFRWAVGLPMLCALRSVRLSGGSLFLVLSLLGGATGLRHHRSLRRGDRLFRVVFFSLLLRICLRGARVGGACVISSGGCLGCALSSCGVPVRMWGVLRRASLCAWRIPGKVFTCRSCCMCGLRVCLCGRGTVRRLLPVIWPVRRGGLMRLCCDF